MDRFQTELLHACMFCQTGKTRSRLTWIDMHIVKEIFYLYCIDVGKFNGTTMSDFGAGQLCRVGRRKM